jgi:Asp-tRNA(Asn)/Glu-tRNA(Gln) amidotransferase A subunit family amidase
LRQRPILAIVLAIAVRVQTQPAPAFRLEETTIAGIHAAMKAGQLTCRELVQHYLRRIDAFDKNGPAINAIVLVNPNALAEADTLDARYKQSGLAGPLHCIPTIVKDNFETIGLQSAAGSLALKGFVSTKDAYQVRRMKEAGALVLAKSNMAEWAFTPYETVSSILPGYTRNPYALDRVTAGSSGGTAAAVAANLGAVGLGSDTGNSIRGPASHQSLVGIRSTMGLTSRAGVVPLNLLADIAGPMTRTMADAVTVFNTIVGEDADDPITLPNSPLAKFRPANRPAQKQNYTAALVRDGLGGTRIGVLRQAYERDTTDAEIVRVFEAALDDMKRAGATIVNPAIVPVEDIRRAEGAAPCGGFKYDINRYLASHGDRIPVKSLDDIIKSRRFHPSVHRRLEQSQDAPENGPDTPGCQAEAEYRERIRAEIVKMMDSNNLDAFVYPTWSNPPRLIGDLNTPHGDNSQFFSPTTGFPAVQVPMGYTRGGLLPAGITFLGRPWDEFRLIRLAYSFEQHTAHRRPPPTAPPLR